MPLVGKSGGLGRGIAAIVSDAERDSDVADLSGRVGELGERVAELERELARVKPRREYLTAEEMYLSARCFIDANPTIWSLIKSHATAAASEGRRFSMKREFEDLRDECKTVGDYEWMFPNPLAAPLVRFLLIDVPEVDPYIKRGKSKVDKYFNGQCEPPHWPPVKGGGDGASPEG